jgi:hypothetical protein
MALDDEARAALEKFIEPIDDHDDSHRIYTG